MIGSEVRDKIVFKTLHEELVGPCAYGEAFTWQDGTVKKNQLNVPLTSADDGEEIIKVYPLQRYGVGVLYPVDDAKQVDDDAFNSSQPEPLSQSEKEAIEPPTVSKQAILSSNDGSNDFDISLANARMPSSMGLSFALNSDSQITLEIRISGSFYSEFKVQDGENHTFNWWKRNPVAVNFEFKLKDEQTNLNIPLSQFNKKEPKLSEFYVQGVIRNYGNYKVITIALVNRSKAIASYSDKNRYSLFQSQLNVKTKNGMGLVADAILPYQNLANEHTGEKKGNDELSNDLLYRITPSFAKGHGVAVDWNLKAFEYSKAISEVYTSSIPTFETPSITAEIENRGKRLTVSMEALSDFDQFSEGEQQLNLLINWYEEWIKSLIKDKEDIECEVLEKKQLLLEQANKHISKCREAHIRMSEGLNVLQSNEKAKIAFRLANLAMLNQQKRAPKKMRKAIVANGSFQFESEFKENSSAQGIWRPFQIGFLLMCISGAVDPDHNDHELVDLIWFPTGGGKTEAYLGLAAFTLIYNRLMHGTLADSVQVLMRYTLRLLTAQQLQRASTLICCLESIRRKHNLPGKPFSIGLWVGSKNTPNKRAVARNILGKIRSNLNRRDIDNPFLLDRCPHCSAQLGVAGQDKKFLLGYKEYGGTVKFHCEDKECLFHEEIPVYLIDEDIYDKKPSIVIATVDKFAMLAWEPKIRNLFGIDEQGKREKLPPQLIIQDELHLITGPLGTMVGLYEPLIEELCSYQSPKGIQIKPKIICATATTKGYQEQVQSIYGRSRTDVFPPPGLTAEDSFFSRYERDENNNLKPGRKYVGVCAPGLGSVLTAQVRTHSALLFSSNRASLPHRDPWVTLLSFYNSIRELGGALTLFQADIISYLLELKRRYPSFLLPRFINGGMELTSRLKNDEIPAAISLLERRIDSSELNKEFYASLGEEINRLTLKHQDLKVSGDKLLVAINDKKILSVDEYIYVDTFRAECKKNDISYPKRLKQLLSLINGRDVTPYCLASSIIEVGVDIDRLSLMSIVGQPKTTAQYIQVSGRVGRRATERPGLVTTIFNNAKPRDKSHYEDFRAYHQKLYAQVEPASVTPYSRPAIERGFSALMIAYARQYSPLNAQPPNIDMMMFDSWFEKLLNLRRRAMQEHEREDLSNYFERRFKKSWNIRARKSDSWGTLKPDTDPSEDEIMCRIGSNGRKMHQFECPTSMRNVDGESVVWINPEAYEQPENDEYFDFNW